MPKRLSALSMLSMLSLLTLALIACQLQRFVAGFFVVMPIWAVMVVGLPFCLVLNKR